MSYDTSGIQQEGRLFEIGKETGSVQGEYGESKGGKVGRGKRWKHAFTCENCGTRSPGRSNEANRFCKQACQHEWVVNKWLKCSMCHAKIGIGSQTSGKLLNIAGSNVSKGWKQRGIVANRPKSGSWATWASARMTEEKAILDRANRFYLAARMSDIGSHEVVFPEWDFAFIEKAFPWTRAGNPTAPKTPIPTKRNYLIVDFDPGKEPKRKGRILNRSDKGIRNDCRIIFYHIMSKVRKSPTNRHWVMIGCSELQLKRHLESRFKKGMSWDNYGKAWHVDHTLPCASFDHRSKNQRLQCWHWTNLQPLDASENIRKGAKIQLPQMQLLLQAH